MLPAIPEDAIEFIRAAVTQANQRATSTLARQPSMHEEGLDFQLIAALDEVGSRVLPGSGAAVEIETHWLGGRRLFDFLDHRGWEIADIGLLVAVLRLGVLLARKGRPAAIQAAIFKRDSRSRVGARGLSCWHWASFRSNGGDSHTDRLPCIRIFGGERVRRDDGR
jgi:hypothetical protein